MAVMDKKEPMTSRVEETLYSLGPKRTASAWGVGSRAAEAAPRPSRPESFKKDLLCGLHGDTMVDFVFISSLSQGNKKD